MPVASFTGAGVALSSGAHQIIGWSVAENALPSSVARVRIRDGSSTAGTLVTTINLLPNDSARDVVPQAITVTSGAIYVEIPVGSAEGAIWYV